MKLTGMCLRQYHFCMGLHLKNCAPRRVNRATTKAGKGTFTWRLALKPGLYRYRSDATPTLRRSFRVAA